MLPLLRMRLHHTIGLWIVSAPAIDLKQFSFAKSDCSIDALTAQGVPIKRVGNATSMQYACAIAHQLAPTPQHTIDIAAQLAKRLQQELSNDREPFLQTVTVAATATGFLHFAISDRSITVWLNSLLANSRPLQPLPTAPISEPECSLIQQTSALFEVQHVHARCCSLLQLAHREAVIRLDSLEMPPDHWRFSSPEVPWLTSTDQLCFQHPVDRTLLVQLFDAYDHLFDPHRSHTQASVLRSAHAVAQAFESFQRAHLLWGRANEASALTLARLRLLMITQRVLALLLWDGLHLHPVVAL